MFMLIKRNFASQSWKNWKWAGKQEAYFLKYTQYSFLLGIFTLMIYLLRSHIITDLRLTNFKCLTYTVVGKSVWQAKRSQKATIIQRNTVTGIYRSGKGYKGISKALGFKWTTYGENLQQWWTIPGMGPCFMPRMSTTYPVFALRVLTEV